MAQLKYRGNLTAKAFPFLSTQFGQTVIMGGSDQGAGSESDSNFPQAYYMHNVMPTGQGYKSVAYTTVLTSVGVNFTKVIPIRNPNMDRGWLGITSTGKVYIYKAGDSVWTDITAQALAWAGGPTTVAYANGVTYVCLQGAGVFKVDVTNRTITKVTLNGLVTELITSITSCAGYMLVTDGITVYWSSTLTPEDFVPSLITGAGSGIPESVEGKIVALVQMSNGFAIYTSVNVVLGAYTQNSKYPWVFREAANSKGISDVEQVTGNSDFSSSYAWTSAGLQRISADSAVVYMPEVTDFLAGKVFEDWDTTNNKLVRTALSSPMQVRLAFLGARYLVISYGMNRITHAVVYDTSLKRWGKLRVLHVGCFELSLNTDTSVTNSSSASAKKTFGFIRSDGQVSICNFDSYADSDDSLIILGKFQAFRNRLTTMQTLDIECADPNNTSDFSVQINSSLDGKNVSSSVTPALTYTATDIKKYASRVSGINHSLVIKGTFNLNSFELALTINGRR